MESSSLQENLNRIQQEKVSKNWENGVRKSIEVNGREWSYLEYGNPHGIQILELHGWGGTGAEGNDLLSRTLAGEEVNSYGLRTLSQNSPETAKSIANTIRSLEGKYHIIAPELPGSGVTSPLEKISIDNLVDELADFQKTVGIKNNITIGGSAGGIYAIKLAARYPQLDTKAVVLEGTITKPDDMDKKLYLLSQTVTFGPIPNIVIKTGIDKKLWAFIIRKTKDYQVSPPEIREIFLENALRGDPITTVKILKDIGKDIRKDIQNVECPVIVLDGVHGDMIPILKQAEQATRFHPETSSNSEKIRQKKVLFLPIGGKSGEHGHGIFTSFPEGVVSLVDASLDKMVNWNNQPKA